MHNKEIDEEAQKINLIEQGFNLKLPTKVEGVDVNGKKFQEKTKLTYISHSGSSFWLNSTVAMGTDLRLSIDIPQKLSEDKNLKLIIKGKVVFIESDNYEKDQKRISLRFENKYIITEP
ncbi:MAG: PilZ domain-containing protein [Candidatus Aminicenantaceae bacterium]